MSGQTMFFALAAGGLAALYFYRSESAHAGASLIAELSGQIDVSAADTPTVDKPTVEIITTVEDTHHKDASQELNADIMSEQPVEQLTEQLVEPLTEPLTEQPNEQSDNKLIIIHDYELASPDTQPRSLIKVPTIRLRTQM